MMELKLLLKGFTRTEGIQNPILFSMFSKVNVLKNKYFYYKRPLDMKRYIGDLNQNSHFSDVGLW